MLTLHQLPLIVEISVAIRRGRGGALEGGARRSTRRGVQGGQAQRAENGGVRKRGRPPRPPTFQCQVFAASDMEKGTRSA